MQKSLDLATFFIRRLFDRLNNLTGHIVHTESFKILALFIRTLNATTRRLNIRKVRLVPYEGNTYARIFHWSKIRLLP